VIPAQELLTVPCDVLMPAAIGGVITDQNAGQLQCKFVVEAANGPTTPEVGRDRFEHLCLSVFWPRGPEALRIAAVWGWFGADGP
jgi:glutamate dehydrogenase/leucine dehydrogenase